MKNRKKVVEESLSAIEKITNLRDLRPGLAATILAIRDGEISPQEGNAIARAAAKRQRKITSGL